MQITELMLNNKVKLPTRKACFELLGKNRTKKRKSKKHMISLFLKLENRCVLDFAR